MKKRYFYSITTVLCLCSAQAYSKNVLGLKPFDSGVPKIEQDTVINQSGIADRVAMIDWKKAPNSYIFDPAQSYSGLYIPVKKAYAMWSGYKFLGYSTLPHGAVTADVLWEDTHGLIKSGSAYALEISGSGENAKIKVPVNKAKKGNAVVAFRINGEIYWSWHIWVTDDPTNGSTYKSFEGISREKSDGTTEIIPDAEWKWMDRNLGAISSSITAGEWNRNGGLLYQWGRKDPIPPLVYRGNDFYEVSGSIGRVRHRGAKNFTNAVTLGNLFFWQTLPLIITYSFLLKIL